MNKTYQIKTTDAQGKPLIESIQPDQGKKPKIIKAVSGACYNLVDVQQGSAPDNIRIVRSGKNLKVLFDGEKEPSLLIEDFYEVNSDGQFALVGQNEQGAYYEYVPETAAKAATVGQLKDTGQIFGMVLGGDELPATSGAAVGLLVPVAAATGTSPLLLGAGALGAAGAAAGGSGGGQTTDTSPAIAITSLEDDQLNSHDTGVKNNDFVTSDTTLAIKGTVKNFSSAAGNHIFVQILDSTGKEIASGDATTDSSGNWTFDNTKNELKNGVYTVKASILDKANAVIKSGSDQQLVIDNDPNRNSDPTKPSADPTYDPLGNATATIVTLVDSEKDSRDTGPFANDFVTSDNTLVFKGKVIDPDGDPSTGRWVQVSLDGKTLAYVPLQADGSWSYDNTTSKLNDGSYLLEAKIVDQAGNIVGTTAKQLLQIDSSATQDSDPAKASQVLKDDPLKNASVKINSIVDKDKDSNDTGVLSNDFVTTDNTLVFKGTVTDPDGDPVKERKVAVYVSGTLIGYTAITSQGDWSFDYTSKALDQGSYKLEAKLVDLAGNVVSTPAEQLLRIDGSSSKNTPTVAGDVLVADPNATAIPLLTSINGNKTSGDWFTKITLPAFSGSLNQKWIDNTDILKIQIFDLDGHLLATNAQVVQAGANTWSTPAGWIGNNLADGTYVTKVSVEDIAGNVIGVHQRIFEVDTTVNASAKYGGTLHLNSPVVTSIDITGNERVSYLIHAGNSAEITGIYDGTSKTLASIAPGTYNAGDFWIKFTDDQGNTTTESFSYPINFNSNTVKTLASSTYTAHDLSTTGPIGSYNMTEPMLDLSNLINYQAQTGQTVAINQVSMQDPGAQHLTLNLNDVLSLGVSNSFISTGQFKDTLQMRIMGGSEDTLTIENLTTDWTPVPTTTLQQFDGHTYRIYTAHNGSNGLVELFVEQSIQIH